MTDPIVVNSMHSPHPPCFQRMVESKLTDSILVIGALALFTIGILASSGTFQCMGSANALYFSYGMYTAAAVLIFTEIVKVAINCARRNHRAAVIRILNAKHPFGNPIKVDQITKIVFKASCQKTSPCQHSCTINLKSGMSFETQLWGNEATSLIEAVGQGKCTFDDPKKFGSPSDHFPPPTYCPIGIEKALESVMKRMRSSNDLV